MQIEYIYYRKKH